MSFHRGLLEVFKWILEHNDCIGEQRIQLADSLVSQISEVCKNMRKDKELSFKKVHMMCIANCSRGKLSWYGELSGNLLNNFCSWMSVLYRQRLLHRLFHWKSFVFTNKSAKATKLSTMNVLQCMVCCSINYFKVAGTYM